MKGTLKLCSLAVVAGLAAACSAASNSPTSPSTTMPSGLAAAADGSTLKVTAPLPESPGSGTMVGLRPSFSFGGSSSTTGVDVVLNSDTIAWAAPGTDTTNEVVQRLNALPQ